jgi:hypothetical protein
MGSAPLKEEFIHLLENIIDPRMIFFGKELTDREINFCTGLTSQKKTYQEGSFPGTC